MKRLGIDVGGTFTDFVLLDEETGAVSSWKLSSTPGSYHQAIQKGIESARVDLSSVRYIVYGTTIGVNTVIERTGAVVGLLTTEGFEDILDIGWMTKPEMYSLFYRKPTPLVLRRNRLGIDERVDTGGTVLKAVDEAQTIERIADLRSRGVQSLAISTINAYANSSNELRIAEIVRATWPGVPISISSQIVNQRREFERTSTAVLNAYVALKLAQHFQDLETWLTSVGFGGTFFVMRSNGGVMTLKRAKTTPVHTLLSGPVGGSIACQTLGSLLKLPNLIGFDMGGTSTDISVVHHGKPMETAEATVEGLPMMTPVIYISYIGSGGGSLCRIEGETSLRVGPESAGAEPGPVCYGRGGTQATTTDANLVLGVLSADILLADTVQLDLDSAAAALQQQIAGPLGLGLAQAAEGIIRVADVKMAYAIRAETVGKGLDPRDFTLIAFGGGGPMHAASVAAELGIPRVIIPPAPGNLSAWGMLNTDIRHDLVRTINYAGATLTPDSLTSAFSGLESEGRHELESEGVPLGSIRMQRGVDMRYVGQEHTLTVEVPSGGIDPAGYQQMVQAFHRLHHGRYGFSNPSAPAEIVNLRLQVLGVLAKPLLNSPSNTGNPMPHAKVLSQRQVIFNNKPWLTPVFQREQLEQGISLTGPAIVVEAGCTTLLPPGFHLSVDSHLNMILTRVDKESS